MHIKEMKITISNYANKLDLLADLRIEQAKYKSLLDGGLDILRITEILSTNLYRIRQEEYQLLLQQSNMDIDKATYNLYEIEQRISAQEYYYCFLLSRSYIWRVQSLRSTYLYKYKIKRQLYRVSREVRDILALRGILNQAPDMKKYSRQCRRYLQRCLPGYARKTLNRLKYLLHYSDLKKEFWNKTAYDLLYWLIYNTRRTSCFITIQSLTKHIRWQHDEAIKRLRKLEYHR